MKFGKYLKSQEVPGWEFYYLSYNRIKKQLVQKASTSAEALQTQKNFQLAIEKELEKINSYFTLKSDELYDLALQVKQRVKDGDLSNDIDEELDKITTEMIQLDRYQKLNYLGFIKLLKKHDKKTNVEAKQWFMLRVEDSPFVKKDVDNILLQVSETWKSVLSQRSKKVVEERKGGESGQSQVFERKTTKYWVPISNVLEVKSSIIKHLPIDVFDKSTTRSDNLTTSVYYDSPDLVLYHDRLQRNEGAVNLRMRSYGKGTKQPIIFVERKTHHDSWVGESSVKQRFTIKSTKLFDFLHGKYSLEEKLKKAKERKEMSEIEIEETSRLSSEIQELVISKELEPKLTTRYTRTAFQMGRDATVRMSLDTDLHMIKEHGFNNNRWGRDLSLPIDENEVTWFPYAILEVKLNLPFGQETPQWITDILEKNKITPIPKFSKFSHGCAVLFADKCQLLPTWLPLLNAREESIEDKLYSFSTQSDTIVRKSSLPLPPPTTTTTTNTVTKSTSKQYIPNSDSKLDTSFSINNNNNNARLEEIKTEIPPISKRPQRTMSLLETADNISMEEDENAPFIIRNRKGGAATREGMKSSTIKTSIGNFMDKVKGCVPCSSSSKAKKAPKPQMPLKVDPKTFFANERTLLHWLSFLIIVQSVGVALMRFSPGYEPWRIGGLIFVAVSLLFMGYAVVRYEQRRIAITNKSKGPYSDRFGPAILVTALLAAVIVNVVLAYKMYFSYACAGKSLLTLNFYQFSPNDVLWHDDHKKLYLVQNNLISIVNSDDTTNILYPGVHTSLTYTNGVNNYLYIGNLNPPSIDEYDITNKVLLRRFYITIPGSNSTNGLNALTFVPDSTNLEGGLFWAGSNVDGSVYTYQLPIKSNSTSTSSKLIGQFYPVSGMIDVNSLYYHKESNHIWSAIGNWLVKIPSNAPSENTPSSTVMLLGFPSVDGITVKGSGDNTELFVACNSCHDIWEFPFNNYDPISSGKCYPTSASDFTGSVKAV